ncbi:MAG: S-layer homology domain-containing protein [Clostridia bacterium]|nr:S-layer homology domain-containing protein [Clostridia bacterium]
MKIKRIISALTSACILFSSLTALADKQYRISDNFESYDSLASEGVWTTKNPIVTENDGNKVAAFGAGTNQTSLYLKHDGFSPEVTGVIANFSIKFEGDLKQHIIFGASSDKTPSAGVNRVLQFYAGGSRLQLCASGNYNIYYTYTTDKWYDVSIRLNYNTGYYELLIRDGDKEFTWKKTVPELKRNDAQKKSQNHYVFWIDKIANQKVLIDNVDIYGTTDERIYPVISESENFEGFESSDGTQVPEGFESESELGTDNGFVSAGGALKFVSSQGKNLSLVKTLNSEIAPSNVSVKLKDGTNSSYSITVTDVNGNAQAVNVLPGILNLGEESASFEENGTETLSVTVKGGKLSVIIYNENDFATLEMPTELSGLKSFEISSTDEIATDIIIDEIKWGTSVFFERTSASVGSGKTAPGTDKITLEFSNILANGENGSFFLDGDVQIEDVLCSGKTVELILSEPLSPDSSYTLFYEGVCDIEGTSLSDEIPFETDVKIASEIFDIEKTDNGYTLTAELKANVEETIDALLILTAYDNETGKILSLDFKNIEIIPALQLFTVEIEKPDCESCTVEAYLWDSFENMNTLGYSAVAEQMLLQSVYDADFIKSAEFTSDLKISISGEASENPGGKASVMIYPSGNDLSGLSSVESADELLEIIDYYRELDISEDGTFGCDVLFDDSEKGYRDIKITIDGVSETYEKAVYVVKESDITDFVETINSWKSYSDADSGYIVENIPLMAEEDSVFAKEESLRDKFANELVNVRKVMHDDKFKNLADVKSAFDMATLTVMLEGCTNADDAESLIELYGETSGFSSFCFMKHFDECKNEVLDAILNAEKLSTENLIDIAGEKTVLTLVNNVSNHNEITDILNEQNDFLELDLKKYNALKDKSRVNKGLMKKTDSLHEFKKAFKNLMEDETENGGKKPSGSSGSSSSSSSGKIVGNVTFDSEPAQPNAVANYFNDLGEYEWAKESINYLAEKSIVSGVGGGKFEPSRYVTREEFVKMIVTAFSASDETATNPFEDIKENDWCKNYVATAHAKGFVNGISDTEFGKGASIRREDAAVILARIAGKKSSALSNFKDTYNISDYAKDAVNLMYEMKVINGNENGEFLPKNALTRAECAKIIYSLLMQLS